MALRRHGFSRGARAMVVTALVMVASIGALPDVLPAGAIYGGSTSSEPWVGVIVRPGSGSTLSRSGCSAVLFQSQYALTSAHCNAKPGWKLVFKRPSLNAGGGAVYSIAKSWQMPGYRFPDGGEPRNDVRVIKLTRRASVTPLRLAGAGLSSSKWDAGDDVRVYGYGYRTPTNRDGKQREAVFRVNTPSSGYQGRFMVFRWTGRQICGMDSGGPVTKSVNGVRHLVGIVSYAQPGSCNGKGYNGAMVVGWRGSWAKSGGYEWVTRCMSNNANCD